MTNERCAEILHSIKFMLSSEQYSDEVEEALDKAIKAMGHPKAKMFKVPDGQDPYNAIGEYIRDHITVIEDIIAVIEIDGSIINTLFSVDIDEYGYFTWYTDWYEGEKDVTLIDFFPVSEATKPIAEPERTIGHWIERRKKGSCYWQSWCSVCGKHSGIGGIESNRHKPFCPNCGSPMEGVEYEF